MVKSVIILLCLCGYACAGPVGLKKNMPIVEDDEEQMMMEAVAASEEKPASEMMMSKLNLPSNATSIRADITDGFSCENKTYGYYADVENECQIFHVCLPVVYADGKENTFRWSFICPEETIFSQDSFTCMRAEDMSIECEESFKYYELNRNFGMIQERNPSDIGNEEEDDMNMEDMSRQPEPVSEDKPEILAAATAPAPVVFSTAAPIKKKETPSKVQMTTPNRRKNQNQINQKRKPTQPLRKMPTTVQPLEEIPNEEEFERSTLKPVSVHQRFTKRPPVANVQSQKQDKNSVVRPDIFNQKRKRPQFYNKKDAVAVVEQPAPEAAEEIRPHLVQVQPEPKPTLKIETFFRPSSYQPAENSYEVEESAKEVNPIEEEEAIEEEEIQNKNQYNAQAEASEITVVSVRPAAPEEPAKVDEIPEEINSEATEATIKSEVTNEREPVFVDIPVRKSSDEPIIAEAPLSLPADEESLPIAAEAEKIIKSATSTNAKITAAEELKDIPTEVKHFDAPDAVSESQKQGNFDVLANAEAPFAAENHNEMEKFVPLAGEPVESVPIAAHNEQLLALAERERIEPAVIVEAEPELIEEVASVAEEKPTETEIPVISIESDESPVLKTDSTQTDAPKDQENPLPSHAVLALLAEEKPVELVAEPIAEVPAVAPVVLDAPEELLETPTSVELAVEKVSEEQSAGVPILPSANEETPVHTDASANEETPVHTDASANEETPAHTDTVTYVATDAATPKDQPKPSDNQPSLTEESESENSLIVDFISSLVNSESSKLEEDPAKTNEMPSAVIVDPVANVKEEEEPIQTQDSEISPSNELPITEENTPVDMYQIPVQIIQSPIDEPQAESQAKPDVEDETAAANIEETYPHILSIDDIVEIVKERLDEASAQLAEKENLIQAAETAEPQSAEVQPIYYRVSEVNSNLLNSNDLAADEPSVQVVEQKMSAAEIDDERQQELKAEMSEISDKLALVEEHRKEEEAAVQQPLKTESISLPEAEPELVNDKRESEMANNEQAAEVGAEAEPTANRSAMSRSMKIAKMDPRKRRFLFRSDAS